MRLPAVRFGMLAAIGYVAAAIASSWPLPRYFSTHLTGTPGGDAGVYVWNLWVFRHELIERAGSPLSTSTILPLDGPVPLGLHNYTIVNNLLSLPFQPLLGVMSTFNALYLAHVALAGAAVFALARRVTRAQGARGAEAWLAGLLFAWSPFLLARSTGHFSLVSVAPLPFFALFLDRALDGGRARDAVAAGGCLAWAAYSDPYYAIYGLLLALFLIVPRAFGLVMSGRGAPRRPLITSLDAAIVTLAAGTFVVHVLAGGALDVGPVSITARSLHTPVLVVTALVVLRLLVTARPRLQVRDARIPREAARVLAIAGVTAAVLVSPVLIEVARMAAAGLLVRAPVPWRSSPPGLDLLSFVLPSPMHAAAPAVMHDWLARQSGGWAENIATIPYVAVAVFVGAWRLASYRPDRRWLAVGVGFALLSLGPFLRVAGISTLIPLPWAVLRYVPLIGEARMPQRFAVVAMMGLAVLFAAALAHLGRQFPHRRRAILLAVGLAMTLELLPIPRVLHVVRVPQVHRDIAADPAPVRVLELPYGIRDGLSSYGNYNPTAQVFQTVHGKPLLNGYLSRVPPPTRDFHLAIPMLGVLTELSAGRQPPADALEEARRSAPGFVADARLGYVIVDVSRTSDALHRFAVDALGLTRLSASEQYVLYRPAPGP